MTDKKKAGKQPAQTALAFDPKDFDLSKLLPEGVTIEDFEKAQGERYPIINVEAVFAHKIPVYGLILGVQDMPLKEGDEPWSCVVMLLKAPSLSKNDDGEIVKVEAERRALLRVSGGLKGFKNFEAISRAASDPENVYAMIVHCLGKTEITKEKKTFDMWDFDVRILWSKPIKRTAQLSIGAGLAVRGQLPERASASNPY